MSEPFDVLTAIAAPLARDNIDTDLIWPVRPGLSVSRGDQARNAFASLRYDEAGHDRPDFVLNRAPYSDAEILVTGRNFGCGSSREMAVWALREWGLRCIIAPSFGDIFYGNAVLNGLLPVRLPEAEAEALRYLVAKPEDAVVTVDLVRQRVRAGDLDLAFEIDGHSRSLLLQGLDETGFTLALAPIVAAFGERYALRFPWTVRPPATGAIR